MSAPTEYEQLLDLAVASIEAGMQSGRIAPLPDFFRDPCLQARRSSFVTLRVAGELRGCCGTLEARRALAADVWHNAWAAAFDDPRFEPLARVEWLAADVCISVLSALEPLPVCDEDELLEQLRPGIDGILLELGGARATFLPAVWEQLPVPVHFLRHLKRKAGMPDHFWSAQIRVHRYTACAIGPRAVAASASAGSH